MLDGKKPSATVAVKDMAAARKFYEDKVGLKVDMETPDGGVMYKGPLFMYQSDFAGSNKATAVTWGVGEDIKVVVDGLKDKGIEFEHYDSIPNVKVEGDLHVMGDIKAAWFKDPDGNIHALVNQM